MTAPTPLHRLPVASDDAASPGIGGRCETCRHWVPFEKLESFRLRSQVRGDERKLGLCQAISLKHGKYGVDDPPADAIVLYEDASDYVANLRTAAGFGCVLWEAA